MKITKIIFFSILLSQTTAFSAEITLQQALEQSKNYWMVRIGQSQIQSEASLNLAKSTLLPNVNGAFTVENTYLVSPSDEWQGTGSIDVTQNVVNVSNWLSIDARKSEVVSQACQTESDQIDIYKSVIDLFFAVLANVDEEELQIKRANMNQKAISLLRETTKLKLTTQADLLSAESQAYQIEIERAQIIASKVASLNLLRTQLGISTKEPLVLSKQFVQQDTDITDWPQWPENIPNVLVLKAKVESASKDIAATRWEAFPSIDASVIYSDLVVGPGSNSDALSVIGSLQWPLFDRFSRQIRVGRDKKLLVIFENLLQTEKNQASNDIAALIVQRKADKIAVEQASKQIDISSRAYKDAWTLLSLGKFDFLNVQSAQDVAINAERQWLQIKRRMDQTNANLQILYEEFQKVKNSSSSCKKL